MKDTSLKVHSVISSGQKGCALFSYNFFFQRILLRKARFNWKKKLSGVRIQNLL